MKRLTALSLLACLAAPLPALAVADGREAEAALADADSYTVVVKTTVRYPFGDDAKGRSRGAGFVVDRARGWILTNAHVTSRSVAAITVSFHGGEPIAARRIYVDPFLDLAVLAVPPAALPKATSQARLECGELPRAGVPVVAYGHPGGLLFTGTKGIVSGVSSKYETELLQTDAPINPGNSGGPLINLASGKIAGINTASASYLQNTNFALASRFACPVVDLLRAGRNPAPPRADWRFFSEPEDTGKVKLAWPGSFGARLGLRAGDIILSINGSPRPVNETQVLHALRGSLEGFRIEVEREGRRVSLEGRADPEPSPLGKAGLLAAGMLLTEFDPRISREVDFAGVWVEFVDKGSESEAAEVPANAVLVSVNGSPTPDLAAAKAAFASAAKAGEAAVLVFKRIAGSLSPAGLFNWLERRVAIAGVQEVKVGEGDAD